MSKVLHWIKPTSFVDPDGVWTDEEKAYDELGGSCYSGTCENAAHCSCAPASWTGWLEFHRNKFPCKYISFVAHPSATIEIQAQYKDTFWAEPFASWMPVTGSISYGYAFRKTYPIGGTNPTIAEVDAIRVRIFNETASPDNFHLREIWLGEEREETTKQDIIKMVAKNLRDLAFDGKVTSATNAGTYGVITCNEFGFKTDSALEGAKLWIPEPYATLEIPFGLKNGTEYLIRTFATLDRKIYSIPVFDDVPATSEEFVIFKTHKKEEYDRVFSQVFSRLRQRVLEDVSGSIAVGSESYLYDVLGDMDYVHAVEIFATGATIPTTFTNWSVDNGLLRLGTLLDPSSYPTLRAMGQKHPVMPTLDIATMGVRKIEDVVVQRMTEYMAVRDTHGADKDFAYIAENAKSTGDILEAYLIPRFKPNSVKVR